MKSSKRGAFGKLFVAIAIAASLLQSSATFSTAIADSSGKQEPDTFSADEILDAGRGFFGSASKGLGDIIAFAFRRQGRPTAYILGEEGAGAFVGGLRYGKGRIHYRNGKSQRIFWQGPSVGYDFGANGSRTMVLVYKSTKPSDLYHRFVGVEGSAYLVAGAGINFQVHDDIVVAPIRTGVGLRYGANLGYLKYSPKRDWNPF